MIATNANLRQRSVVPSSSKAAHTSLGNEAQRPLVRIHLLGAMSATSYLGHDLLPRGRRARAILGYLCLLEGRSASRSRLGGLLWDRVSEAQSRASLRQALSEIATKWSPIEGIIKIDRERITLDTSVCWIDVFSIAAMFRGGLRGDYIESLENIAASLLENLDGLSGGFDDWLAAERSHFVEKAKGLLADRLSELQNPTTPPSVRAIEAQVLLRLDPTNEKAWQILIKTSLETGNRSQALLDYRRCRETLLRMLDAEPMQETRDLLDFFSKEDTPENRKYSSLHNDSAKSTKSRLKIGVPVFATIGGSNENTLSWSLALDIAAALSRFRWFDVIAPLSLPRWWEPHGEAVKDMRNLEIDYLIQGRIQIGDGKTTVKIVLLDIRHMAVSIWGDAYELSCNQPGIGDDSIVRRIVARIDPAILFIEGTRSRNAPPPSALSLVFEAIPLIHSMEKTKYMEAGDKLFKAMAISPQNSMVCSWLSYWYLFKVGQGWSQNQAGDYDEVERLARIAIQVDPENAEALGIYGHISSYVHHDFDTALIYFDRALVLNPSAAFIWALSAPTFCYLGQPNLALMRLERYRELSPYDPYFALFETMYTMVYMFSGDYDKAVVVGKRSVRANPDFTNGYKPLIAALGHLNRVAEAQEYLRKLLIREPHFSLRAFAVRYPFRLETDRERYLEGLKKAGVPEE